ncbi:MAG: DNA-directed RNA polymerase subunit omega [Clostridia bacterium]|nr:DNA-directed RNA polymerase subunit omega [Clostridia bacterium]
MIHEPSIDMLAEKVGSKYALCIVAAKRARQIISASKNKSKDFPENEKPLTIAANEIFDGKVIATKF